MLGSQSFLPRGHPWTCVIVCPLFSIDDSVSVFEASWQSPTPRFIDSGAVSTSLIYVSAGASLHEADVAASLVAAGAEDGSVRFDSIDRSIRRSNRFEPTLLYQ